MGLNPTPLPMCRAHELELRPPEQNWLIQSIWAQGAVGIIGGAPKCGKSWLALDMALSVTSATPCLGRFPVSTPGSALVYLAEDALASVRARLDALCTHRRLDLHRLELYVITAASLRLDLASDQQRLGATLEQLRPRLLVLDPLVRLHRLDENSAADISRLLGGVRELQRAFDTAIVLVHHASKKQRAQPGQALRGSSDLHAFGDCNAYLAQRQERLVLTLEHRAAPSPKPMTLALVSAADGSATHLELEHKGAPPAGSLPERTLDLLQQSAQPVSRTSLRERLKVNNQRLGEALEILSQQGAIQRTSCGWTVSEPPPQASKPPLRSASQHRRESHQCSLTFPT